MYFALEAASVGVWEWEPGTGSMRCNDRARSLWDLDVPAPVSFDAFLARDMTGTVRDISERHRVHNVFAVTGAVISLTKRSVTTSEQMTRALRRRIDALDRAHRLLRSLEASAGVHLRQVNRLT